MILIRSLLLTASFMMSGILYCQSTVSFTLPVVTLMDIEPAGNITLNFIAPTEAGNALTNPTPDTTKWINYTSAITSGGLTRRITAAVNSNSILSAVQRTHSPVIEPVVDPVLLAERFKELFQALEV